MTNWGTGRRLLLIGAMCLLAGCSGMEHRRQFEALSVAAVSNPNEVKAIAWSEALKAGVTIDESAPAAMFPGGKSFFQVVALPGEPRPLRLRIESVFNPKVGGFFQPELLLLDDNRRIVRSLGAPLAEVMPSSTAVFERSLVGTIQIEGSPPQSAFLMIRTTDELLKPGLAFKATNYIVAPPIVVPIESQQRIPHWPMGFLRIVMSGS